MGYLKRNLSLKKLLVEPESDKWQELVKCVSYSRLVEDNNISDIIGNGSCKTDIHLNNLEFKGDLHLDNLVFPKLSLSGVTANRIYIKNLSVESLEIRLLECDSIHFIDLKANNLYVRHMDTKDFDIGLSNIKSLCIFNVKSKDTSIKLKENKTIDIRDIECVTFDLSSNELQMDKLVVCNLDVKNAHFDLPHIINNFELYGYIEGNCSFWENSSNDKSRPDAVFMRWCILKIQISCNFLGDFQLHNFITHNFNLSYSNTKHGSIDFNGVTPFSASSLLRITSNKLYNNKFYACDFKGFGDKKSMVSENSFNSSLSHGTTWPSYGKYDESYHLNFNEYLNGKKYYYESLSNMCDLSGDSFGKYAYQKEAKNTEIESIKHNSNFSFVDYLPLILSKIFSKYNTSWLIALVWIVLFNFSYFIYLNFSLHDLITAFNPVHRLESLNFLSDSQPVDSKFYFVNFIMRIINSFLVFKFIKSFRKYY